MDKDPNKPPRVVRFKPRKPKPARRIETPNNDQNDGNAVSNALIRLVNENLGIRQPEVDTKSSAKVAIGPGPGGCSSSSLKTYGSGSGQSSSTSAAIGDQSDDTHMIAVTDGPTDATAKNSTNASACKIEKGYKEPWDYKHSNYPTTLPWRKPYSGDPAILDEEEFGEAASKVEYDENTINPAKELGLLDKSEEKRMFFVQLPPMPLLKQAMSRKGKEKIGTSTEQPKLHTLKDLPEGYMGKMLIYESGAVKLKLGETLFDVSPGTNTEGDQDLIAINAKQETFCVLGPVDQKAVVSLAVDSIDQENLSHFFWMKEKSSLTKRE